MSSYLVLKASEELLLNPVALSSFLEKMHVDGYKLTTCMHDLLIFEERGLNGVIIIQSGSSDEEGDLVNG